MIEKFGVRLVLCADDFGISKGVDDAILELSSKGRLSAISCMTVASNWVEEGKRLVAIEANIGLGLHLTITDQFSIAPIPHLAPNRSLPSFKNLLFRAVTGRLDREELFNEFRRQVDAFTSVVNRPPDFIDGHHHVHQLPIVRESAIDLIRRNVIPKDCWLRCCWEPPVRIIRRRVDITRGFWIGAFGLGLRKRADQVGFSVNRGFTGLYNPQKRDMNAELMEQLLRGIVDGTVMNCHPGYVDDTLRQADPLTASRETESAFLMSDEFRNLLERNAITLMKGDRNAFAKSTLHHASLGKSLLTNN